MTVADAPDGTSVGDVVTVRNTETKAEYETIVDERGRLRVVGNYAYLSRELHEVVP